MKKKAKKTIKLVVFLAVAFAVFLGLSEGAKDINLTPVSSIKGFYTEPKDSLDVVLIGASEIYTGYSPTEAWKEHGYTSYDLASPGLPGTMYKSMLKEVLRKQKPKVVVFEFNGFLYEEEYFQRSGNLHNYIDNMQISSNWVETIRENIPKEEQKYYFFPLSTYHDNWKRPSGCMKNIAAKAVIKLSGRSNLKGVGQLQKYYFFPLSTYHDNWKRPSGCMKNIAAKAVIKLSGRSNLKGVGQFSLIRSKKEKLSKDNTIMLTDLGRKKLHELCQTCKEEGVENVLFARFPHLRETGNKKVYPEIEQIVTSYGYDFVNLNDYKKLGLEKDHDFYNRDHLNYWGMKKFTKFFSNYLVTNYDLKPTKDEKLKERWDACTKKADEVFALCEEDFQKGNVRHYIEPSCYIRPRIRNEK